MLTVVCIVKQITHCIFIKTKVTVYIKLFSLTFNSKAMYIDNKMDSLSSLKSFKRHYKKDSRYVNDLYTLTYDNHESLDTIELISNSPDVDDKVSLMLIYSSI